MTEMEQRLRRHLRAMGAVNQSLHDRLEQGEGAASGARRAGEADPWLAQLQLAAGGARPHLVRVPGRAVYVVEGNHHREVRSGLLAAALEALLGTPDDVDDAQLARSEPGAPVELLEGPSGLPFIVLGGARVPVRGIPLPYPVGADDVQRFPETGAIDVAAANVSRARFDAAIAASEPAARVRAALSRLRALRARASTPKHRP